MKSFVISCTFILISCIGFAQSRQYLLAGQSNARGRGDATLAPTVEPMTSYEYHPNLDILFQLADPVGVSSGGFQKAATGSAWPAFGKTYYDMTGDTTVMIPAARGGSGVHPISASSGANWSSNGLLYSLCQFKVDQAMMLTGLPLDGIVWVQGEQDAARINFGAYEQDDYRDALIELIDRFRDDYGCALPFYMVLLGANTEDAVEGYNAVRAAQVEVAAIHPHTYLIHENAVNFPGMGWMWDNVHYTQDGYNEIGVVGATNVVEIERTYYSITKSGVGGSSANDTICRGDSIMLSAPPMYTDYLWSNGETTQNIFATEGGEYTVTVTDPSGCEFPLHSVNVNAYPDQIRPMISLSANDTLCSGDMLTLTASPAGQNYLWSTGATAAAITVNTSDDFFVQTIDTNGCLSLTSDTISTTVLSLSTPIITSNNTSSTICQGDSVVLSAPTGFDDYLWSNGETTQNITITDSGMFSCAVKQADCLSEPSAPFEITVIPTPPAPTITWNSPTTFCEGDSVTLTLTASAEYDRYMWSTGDTTQSITVYDSGLYSCIFIGENDCEGTAASPIFITENPLPAIPSITAVGSTELCQGDELILNAPQGFDAYLWSTGESTPSITVNTAGTFDVIVFDSNGCESPPSASITTTINPLPIAPTIIANSATTFCEGDSVTLTVPAGLSNYQWSNGETTQSITVYDSNSYFCIVTDANGCVSPVSAPINTTATPAPPAPIIATNGPTTFCEGDSVILSAPSGFFGYQWSNGETTQSITVYDSGTFDVLIANNSNCQSPISAPISVTSISATIAPLIVVTGNTTLCEGDSVILTAPSGLSGYLWSNGAITQSITLTDPGTFDVMITSADGCESPPSAPITVTVNPLPTTPLITPNNSTTFCQGDSVILAAPNGFMDYLWSNGETTQSITVSTSGTFEVIVTDTNSCTSAPSVSVATILNTVPTPSITAQSSITFCEGDSVILTAPSGFTDYLWSNGETTQSITVTDSDTYDVIVTDTNDCQSMPSAPITTTVISATTPPTIIVSGATNICQGESVTLSAPAGFSDYLWSNGATTQDLTVNISDTYTCIITSANGCQSPPSDPITITVNPLPNAPTIMPNSSTTFCEGDSIILAAPNGFMNYLWSNGETTQSITVATAGTFDVIVTDTNGCISAPSAPITTTSNAVPTPSITALSSTTFCEGQSVTLTAPSGFTDYLWSNGETTQSITVTDSDTYNVIVTDANDCESMPSAPITTTAISATTAPAIMVDGSTDICQGENVALTAPADLSGYLWSNGATTQSITVSTSGTYICIITSADGCESPPSDPIIVMVNPLPAMPIISSNNSNTFCEGDSVTLTATAGFANYLWSNGATTQSITVSTSGTFDAMVIDVNGCESPLSEAISTNLNVIPTPSITAQSSTTFCEGESVILTAPTGFTNYMWSNGETTQSITVTDSDTYYLIVADANGCESSPSASITTTAISATTAPLITANSATNICAGESITLSAPIGFSDYLWSNGETTQEITVNTPGAYTCIITSANGCESPPSAPIDVTINPLPNTPTITPDNVTTFCEGDSVILAAPNGFADYLWSNGETTQNITVTSSGVFDVIISDANACESSPSASITVNVNSVATPSITASGATTFCEGESVTLSAPSGFTDYLWSNGATTQSITVTDSDTYDVIVTDVNDCESPNSMPVTVVALSATTPPILTASGATSLCEGESVTLSAPAGFTSYLWSNGATTQDITVNTSDTFTCEITSANGCPSPPSTPITVTVNPLPGTPSIVANDATTFCEGDSVILAAPNGFSNYLWSNGETTQNISVSTSGTFDVFVTDTNGCESPISNAITTTVNPIATPTVTASGATTFCEGESVMLTAPSGFTDYLWSNGETTSSITVTDSDTYDVTVTDANGCISPASAPIEVVALSVDAAPLLTANGATTFCDGDSVTLSAPSGFSAYLWSNGATTQDITVTTSGTFTCEITNTSGCESPPSTPIAVTVNPTPATPIIANNAPTTFCEGDSVILSAPNGFTDYLWSNGETTQSITVTDSGVFDVMVTNASACESPLSAPVNVVALSSSAAPEISVSGETTICENDSLTLSAPSGFTGYLWSTGETTQSITVDESGTFTCEIIDNSGCVSPTSAPVMITVNSLPPIPNITISGETTFCDGDSVTLSAPSGFTNYEWSNGETTPTITVFNSGNYDVFVTNTNDCVSLNSPVINVTVNDLPNATDITPSGATTFCEGDSVMLSAPSGFTNYEWSNGETTPTITVTNSGIYQYFVTDGNACVSVNSTPLEVTVNNLPTAPEVAASGPTTFCAGDSVVLSAPPGFSAYEWSTGDTTQSITIHDSGDYDYFVMSGNGCISANSNPINITANPTPNTPTIATNGATTFCEGDSVTLSAPSGFTNYEWSNGDTTQNITVHISGDYDVFVTNTSGCISANSTPVNVTVNTLPSAPELIASSATTFCDGDNVILSAPAGFDTYEWSNGATTQSITVYNSGTFNCFVSDTNGCVSSLSASVDVMVNELPPVPQLIANSETEFCEGGSVTISAPDGFDSYLWSNGETTQDITVSEEGSYDVTITNANGCSSASDASAKVIVNPLPVEPIVQAVGAPVFCEGDSVTLVVPGGFSTYLWSTGETTQDITVSETGAFYCTVTDINGCENVSTAFSTIENEALPMPQITFSGETEFCEGGSVTLFAPSGYFYLWSNGATTQDITVTETTGPLSCVIMDANGCMSEASGETFVKVFTVPPVPTIDTVGLTTLCLGSTVELSAPDGFDSYMWSNGATAQSITVGVSGNYSVAVLNEDGCVSENAAPVNITVNATPLQPTIAVGGSTNFCEGDSVTLSAPPNAPGYLWSNGATTQSITVTETGSFFCMILDEFDCQSQASVTVTTTVFDLPDTPVISLSDDAILCPGDTLTLSAEPGFATYIWSNGAVNEQIVATSDGEYSYIVFDDNGCESAPSETIAIEVRPFPPSANIHSSNDFNFCEGDSITLEADAGYLSYLWSTGETDSIIAVNRADDFFYVADDGFSCEDVISVSVTTGINPPPPISAIEQIGADTLCASQAADSYLWYRNDTLTDFTTRCIAPELSGDWQVVGSIDNCLSEFSTAYEYTGRPVIDPETPPSMNVFPNPASEGFVIIQTINIPEGPARLDIYDVLGRLLYRRQLDIQESLGYEYVLDIERLPDAVYVAVIDAGFSGRFVQKFVVDD